MESILSLNNWLTPHKHTYSKAGTTLFLHKLSSTPNCTRLLCPACLANNVSGTTWLFTLFYWTPNELIFFLLGFFCSSSYPPLLSLFPPSSTFLSLFLFLIFPFSSPYISLPSLFVFSSIPILSFFFPCQIIRNNSQFYITAFSVLLPSCDAETRQGRPDSRQLHIHVCAFFIYLFMILYIILLLPAARE